MTRAPPTLQSPPSSAHASSRSRRSPLAAAAGSGRQAMRDPGSRASSAAVPRRVARVPCVRDGEGEGVQAAAHARRAGPTSRATGAAATTDRLQRRARRRRRFGDPAHRAVTSSIPPTRRFPIGRGAGAAQRAARQRLRRPAGPLRAVRGAAEKQHAVRLADHPAQGLRDCSSTSRCTTTASSRPTAGTHLPALDQDVARRPGRALGGRHAGRGLRAT